MILSGRQRLVAVALLGGSITGCGNEAPGSYFPLQEGLSWHYQVKVDSPEGQRESILTIRNYGQLSERSEYYMRGTSSGNYYFFSKRDDSVTRVAHRAIIDPELSFDEPPRPVIQEPVEAGTRWRYPVYPHLLTSDTEPNLRSILYEVEWEIVATDAVVDTPLGRFDRCLHIRGTAEVAVPRSFLLHLAPHIMYFETNEWYAPNVGLVKLRYAETTDSQELKGGTIDMDLIAFEF